MSRRRVDGRELARLVLRRVRRDGAYANLALGAEIDRSPELSARDRALATELVYGVLRQRALLDHVLAGTLDRPLARVDADVLDVLRLAAYQLLLLDRVPAHAVVDQAVAAANGLRGKRVGGFVNAVLRRIDRERPTADLPDDPVRRLALEHSLPAHLSRRLIDQIGFDDAVGFARSMLERAPLTARANVCKGTVEQLTRVLIDEGAVRTVPGRWAASACEITGLDRPFTRESYLAGLWSAQDEAAQLVAELVDPQPGDLVLDLCAGVGGKAMHLAELLVLRGAQDAAGLTCVDVSPRKLELLAEHGRRLGLRSFHVCCADATVGEGLPAGPFDRVLVDAPCSGLGVLRRHPELKWRWDESALPGLIETQRRLLRTAYRLLKPGGVLVYAVCTVTDEEGPAQIGWLREVYDDLCLDPPLQGAVAPLFDAGVLRLWPHRHGTDGFFVARLVRRASEGR